MADLVQIVDSALASATLRSGRHLVCRPGCTQCCHGVFAISHQDASRLRTGLQLLAAAEPARAARLRSRVADSLARLARGFPGDPSTGILTEDAEASEAFEDFANDEPCPVLDPATGTCDLYAARPVQCRTFGPPVRDRDDHLTVCELCFTNASSEDAARCEMDQSWRPLEDELITRAEADPPNADPTLIAFALTR